MDSIKCLTLNTLRGTIQSASFQILLTCSSRYLWTLRGPSWAPWPLGWAQTVHETPSAHRGTSRQPRPQRTHNLPRAPAAGPLHWTLYVCAGGLSYSPQWWSELCWPVFAWLVVCTALVAAQRWSWRGHRCCKQGYSHLPTAAVCRWYIPTPLHSETRHVCITSIHFWLACISIVAGPNFTLGSSTYFLVSSKYPQKLLVHSFQFFYETKIYFPSINYNCFYFIKLIIHQ